MPKLTKEEKKNLKEKLDYLGLNIERIPKFLKEYTQLNFRITKGYDDTKSKLYRYVPITDIEIYVTPTDRLTDLTTRYRLASPLYSYLEGKKEENLEKLATFIKMLEDLKLDDIKEIEEEQKKLNKMIPIEVKYENSFQWQVYYSDISEKYFMIVPAKELNNAAFFFLLKKQIAMQEAKRKESIFIPISHMDYTGQFFTKSEITDLENYLWFFTKEWPSIYEVYDKKKKASIHIVGKAKIYEKVESQYKIIIQEEEKANLQYKLMKALFLLSTETKNSYSFQTRIDENGGLEFYYQNKKMKYETIPTFVKEQIPEKLEQIENILQKKQEEEEELEKLKQIEAKQDKEYSMKEKQIVTFLECKKSFFGRFRYFFKNKNSKKKEQKKKKKNKIIENEEILSTKPIQQEQWSFEEKQSYTIEDLILICKKLEKEKSEEKNIRLDIKALAKKNELIAKKIQNAILYINEIENHKKSIFEFWRFTNKDAKPGLQESEDINEYEENDKLHKSFDYEEDLETLGKQVDEIQRRKLSKDECDAMFIARNALESVKVLSKKRTTKQDKELINKQLKKWKDLYKKESESIQKKDVEVFGGIYEDRNKLKRLNNTKHREIEKDSYKVLNLNLDTTIEMYEETIRNAIILLNESYHKIQSPYNFGIYRAGEINKKGYEIFSINPENEIKDYYNKNKTEKEIKLYRLNLQEEMPALFYTNIMFYDNFNNTLPNGMDVSSEVLMDLSKFDLELVNRMEFKMNFKENEFSQKIQSIKLYEYNLVEIAKKPEKLQKDMEDIKEIEEDKQELEKENKTKKKSQSKEKKSDKPNKKEGKRTAEKLGSGKTKKQAKKKSPTKNKLKEQPIENKEKEVKEDELEIIAI